MPVANFSGEMNGRMKVPISRIIKLRGIKGADLKEYLDPTFCDVVSLHAAPHRRCDKVALIAAAQQQATTLIL